MVPPHKQAFLAKRTLPLPAPAARAKSDPISGMITEVMAALSSGLPRAEEAAGLAWKGLGAVYPRGYGTGYCHLGGVILGLRRYRQQFGFAESRLPTRGVCFVFESRGMDGISCLPPP